MTQISDMILILHTLQAAAIGYHAENCGNIRRHEYSLFFNIPKVISIFPIILIIGAIFHNMYIVQCTWKAA